MTREKETFNIIAWIKSLVLTREVLNIIESDWVEVGIEVDENHNIFETPIQLT